MASPVARALRPRNQEVNYADLSDPECDSYSSDSHSLRAMPSILKRRRSTRHGHGCGRGEKTTISTTMEMETQMADSDVDPIAENTTLCAKTAIETEMVEPRSDSIARHGDSRGQGGNSSSARERETGLVGSGVDLTVRNSISGRGRGRRGHRRGGRGGGRGGQRGTRWGRQGTQSRRSQPREAEAEENKTKETSNPGPSSIVEIGTSSSEGQAINMRRGSPSPVQVRSCKRTILSWLIDCKLIEEDVRVGYVDSAVKGRITRGGIFCDCCQSEISVWTFEKHAGGKIGQPYEHIYLDRKNTCLQEFQITAWYNPEETERRYLFTYVPKENAAGRNDDACSICGDGGVLICCDKCPSTYHPSCIDMERVPQRDWLCPYCMCKCCGRGEERNNFITCSQCDKKLHWGCFQHSEKEFSRESFTRLYCGPGCRQIYEKLENSLRIRNEIFSNFSWRIVRQTDTVSAYRNPYLENNLKATLTRLLMDESFKTIIDKQTGINVVQSIVYSRSSNIRRIDFSRFYNFVLEKDDAVLAAAPIRFHGCEMAEMPFIATDKACRGQGICRLLMREIESLLRSLEVKTLVIPSVPETVEMWRQKFNFNVISREIKSKISSYNILTFPGTTKLYKDLSARISDVINDNAADNPIEVQNGEEPQTQTHETEVQEPQREQQQQQQQQQQEAGRPLIDLNVEAPQEDF